MDKIQALLKSKTFLSVIAACAVAVILITSYMMKVQGDNTDFAKKGSHLIIVQDGMTTHDIAYLLHEQQLVKNPEAFRQEVRFKGLAAKMKAGAYQIEGGMSNREIMELMAKGEVQYLRFVVPEGYTAVQIGKKLEFEGLGKADKFIAAAKDYTPYDYMKTDDPNVIFKTEGFLFPATYDFPVGISEEQVVKRLVKQFDIEVKESGIYKTVEERKLVLRDVVNMAAMVEKEAAHVDEQPKIAGVFLKRLEIGMPIQSDTTIQYILGAQKEIITYADTEIQNPYNTYQNPGLPPGPIASPGVSAMKAVLEPEKTDYLYFVAENNGYHRFSKTYEEHLRAIREIG